MPQNHPYLYVESPDRKVVVDIAAHDEVAGCTVTIELHGGQVFVQVISDTSDAVILLDEAYDLPDREIDDDDEDEDEDDDDACDRDCEHPGAALSDDSCEPETGYCPDCGETFTPRDVASS